MIARTTSLSGAAVLVLAAAAVVSMPGTIAAEAGGGLVARLDFFGPPGPAFAYTGDPITMRLSVVNEGTAPWSNEQGIDLAGGFRIERHGQGAVAVKAQTMDRKQQPAVIAPQGFFGQTLDVGALPRAPLTPGTYSIRWEGLGITSNTFAVKVIPMFDAAAKYVATLETDYGTLEFDLRSDLAPRHVQNFYNLSHQGYYDDTTLHQIIKGVEVRGGDLTNSGKDFPPYLLDLEIAPTLKHQRGTLSMIRLGGADLDSSTQFVITLSPIPQYDGGLSIFGQLSKGEEVLTALENIPTTGQKEPPYYRPIKPVALRTITVRKTGEAPGL
jgi:cyclophilin family peptidyl-prolyl cis-trans isomerase